MIPPIGSKLRAGIQALLSQARAHKPSPFLLRVIQKLEEALRDADRIE